MKTCPQCGQQFSDDNSFCLNDGSILVLSAHTPARGTGDQPTQVLTTAPATAANSNKGVLYAFVGVLLLLIGGMASYIVFRPGDDSEKFQTISTTKANYAIGDTRNGKRRKCSGSTYSQCAYAKSSGLDRDRTLER